MTTEQPNFFEARAALEEAIERVSRREAALDLCLRSALEVCRRGQEFTSEDVRELVLQSDDPATVSAFLAEPRVLGAAMRTLATNSRAVATDRYVVVGHKRNHARPQRVWRPL